MRKIGIVDELEVTMGKKKLQNKPLIVITGAAGFIGSAVVRYLNDQGNYDLILVDDLKKSEKWKNLCGKHFVDIVSRHDVFDWLEGREKEVIAFIHLGACSDTVESDGDYLLDNNYRFSVALAAHALINNQRFIYASSAATYGDGKNSFSDDHKLLDNLKPLNMYGYSKHLFDLWLKREGLLAGVVGLKYFNVFGPNEYHKGRMASTVLHFTKQIQQEGKVKLFKSNDPQYGDGEQKRDFVYVKDVAAMTCSFLNNKYTGIFNIGSGRAASWNELTRAIFKALNKPVNIEYVEMPKDLALQYQNYTCADMKKYQSIENLDTMPLEVAVKDYVQNYLLLNERW